jgi:hypothetical protein
MGMELQAGRELDVLVAKKVLRWTFRPYGNGGGEWTDAQGEKVAFGGYNGGSLPQYSASIADAWEIVPRFASFYLWLDDATDTWHCHVDSHRCVIDDCRFHAAADEAAEAICLAALMANA